MALPPHLAHLEGWVELLVEALIEDACEILDENGDVPPHYSAEDDQRCDPDDGAT